ncbi:hypothetical protein FACS189452_04500 [Bacteroidia bacterium]|nr:hypothetical protein FACS189452_04500 [Bacteroidia bacterium]GHT81261.1 hypothetical protein FACS189467_5000 [Bacteroidia bacterium]
MTTTKLIIGIVSIVMHGILVFQTCAAGCAGVAESMDGGSADAGANAMVGSMFLLFAMLIGGIVGIAARKSYGGSIFAGIVFIFGAIFGTIYGIASGDGVGLMITWSLIALGFGLTFILGSMAEKRKAQTLATS